MGEKKTFMVVGYNIWNEDEDHFINIQRSKGVPTEIELSKCENSTNPDPFESISLTDAEAEFVIEALRKIIEVRRNGN